MNNEIDSLAEVLNKATRYEEPNKIYFFATSSNMEELQSLRNCLQYSGCFIFNESLAGGPSNYRLHLRSSMTEAELKNIFDECPKSELPSSLVVKNESTVPVTVIDTQLKDSEESVLAYRKKRKNIFLKKIPKIDYEKLEASVKSKVNALDYSSAIQEIIATFDLETFGYEVKVDLSINSNVAITDHLSKRIKIGKAGAENFPDFLLMIRHELEHAQQNMHSLQCDRSSKPSNFSDHIGRERSAYMNDILNIKSICNDNRTCMLNLEMSSLENFDRYIRGN